MLAYNELLADIRRDLDAFGVAFQSWFSEASLVSGGTVEQVLGELRTKGLLFEEEGAWWFRSSQFGDEKDRVVRNKEGEYTYLASDIAYHKNKLERGYDLLIDVWGADHHGYIPRMKAAVQAYGRDSEALRVVLVQMVHLLRGGTKVEMSKRSGEFVLPGMVKLVVQKRKARMGRNPATGEAIKIPAKTVVKARIAKQLKDAVLPKK